MSEHVVTDVSEEILSTYTLCVVGPNNPPNVTSELGIIYTLADALRETEENLTDLLPDGYRVVIKEWSSE